MLRRHEFFSDGPGPIVQIVSGRVGSSNGRVEGLHLRVHAEVGGPRWAKVGQEPGHKGPDTGRFWGYFDIL